MVTLNIDSDSPTQSGYVPDVKTGGTGSVGEYFSQDASMSLWIRPVIASTANALVPWVDDFDPADIYYLAIGNTDDKPTGGTWTIQIGLGPIGPAMPYDVSTEALAAEINALGAAYGYSTATVTKLIEGVYQVDWASNHSVTFLTGDPALLIPASQVLITATRVGSSIETAQQVIDLRQAPVASATVSTPYSPTIFAATLTTPPTTTENAVATIDFGDVFDGYAVFYIRINNIGSTVNISPYMTSSEIGSALALHPQIYYQDPVEPDNISVILSNGKYLVTFIGTLAASVLVRTIANISVAAAAVVTTSAAHGFRTGDTVIIAGADSTPVIDGTRVVTVLSTTTFSVPVTTTVSGSTGTGYTTSQPEFDFDDLSCVYPEGHTGTLNLNTFALAKAFWNTTEDDLTYSLQIKRLRGSGESKTIFGEDIVLKRNLIDIGTLINIPTTGLTTLTLGAEGVATGTLLIKGTTSGTVTVTTAGAAGDWTLTLPTNDGTNGQVLTTDGVGATSWTTNGVGTVSSVGQSFTGGLISVSGSPITTSGTLALTVSGTSGGIPYFSGATTWASSAALAANSLVVGGGAGAAPSTTTTGTGILTFLGTPTSANLAAAVTNETGSGSLVFATSPTLITPVLGTVAAGTILTNATGLPIATGIAGLGTGIATALAVNTGSAGAPVLFNGALGTPSGGTISGSYVTGGTFGTVNGSALTALNSANITASTTNALGIGTIELGHASDTTLARVSAGVFSVEGVTMSTASNTLTLTNKTISYNSNTLSGVQAKCVMLDQDVTCAASSTAVVNVALAGTTFDGLTVWGFPIAANEAVSFVFRFRVVDTPNPHNQRYGINLPAGGAGFAKLQACGGSGTATYDYSGPTDGLGELLNLNATAGDDDMVTIEGSILNGGTAGNVVLMLGQGTASATTFTMKKGGALLFFK